jgi:zinc D-Ala-D-Ala carboxypeptidase
MIANIQFSKNFSLYEMFISQQATRLAIEEQFNPSEAVLTNLENLCKNVLQPLRTELNVPVSVSSGYRCARVNTLIGGASRSQHLTGMAADIQCFTLGNETLLKKIVAMQLPFDQMINEFNYAWVHVSFDASKDRRQVLEAYKNAQGITKYRNIVV